ncbi:MAG: hypothetical protein WCA22_00135 [Candidatus Binatus sp.]
MKHHLIYAIVNAGDYRKPVPDGTAGATRRLDFLVPHVYPEACQATPQVDRDAVIIFLAIDA